MRRLLVFFAVLALVLAACSSDDDDSSSADDTGTNTAENDDSNDAADAAADDAAMQDAMADTMGSMPDEAKAAVCTELGKTFAQNYISGAEYADTLPADMSADVRATTLEDLTKPSEGLAEDMAGVGCDEAAVNEAVCEQLEGAEAASDLGKEVLEAGQSTYC
ncbi:MAG: hypothetical protein KAZ88_00510 [Acidimicrobiia bacterium]|jgi:hypothetical protein|nr:hypothetical protein [Acidimicrobiia bacterium]